MATRLLTSPELFIGTAVDAASGGYTHVLAVTTDDPGVEPGAVQRLHLALNDEPAADLLQHWDAAAAFVLAAAASTDPPPRILVHCQHGVSRSAAVAVAVVATLGGLSVDAAAALVHALRPAVQPNAGFLTQLRLAEQVLQLDAAPAPVPLAGLAPAATARLLRAASVRVAAGMPCDGFDVAAGGLFVCADAWPPRRLSDAELGDLRRAAEGGVPRAAAGPPSIPSLRDALYPSQHDPLPASVWYCCGRCNARLCSSAHVLWDGLAAITVGGGDAAAPSGAGASEPVVILEPLSWMAPRAPSADAASSTGVSGGHRAHVYGRLPTHEQLDALVYDDGGGSGTASSPGVGKLHCPAPRCGAKLGSYAWRARWSRSPGGDDDRGDLVTATSPLFWIPASRLIKRRAA
jgi:protein-tyrosine phosphatase